MRTLFSRPIVHTSSHARNAMIVWPLKENLLQLSALHLDVTYGMNIKCHTKSQNENCCMQLTSYVSCYMLPGISIGVRRLYMQFSFSPTYRGI